jgi:oligo-alginate lyase
MEEAAWAYALTGKKEDAELAATVLRGYAERYLKYEYHDSRCRTGKQASPSGGHIAEQTLNEATMMASFFAPAYDLIYNSGVLSPADHDEIRRGLFLPPLENIDKYRAGKSNWQTWHNAAFLTGGAVLGEVKWVRQAIEEPGNGFLFQMNASLSGDGMWYENSWGYHYDTLSAMVLIVETARRLDIDLWRHPSLKKMFLLPVEYAMPDGALPRFGDDVQNRADGAAQYLEFAWNVCRDPAVQPFLTRRPTWDSVLLGRDVNQMGVAAGSRRLADGRSKLFPSAGHPGRAR